MAAVEQQGTIRKIAVDGEGKFKGFGFIAAAGGTDYFFHRSALPRGVRLEQLREGQTVRFLAGEKGDKGERAERVFVE